MATTSGAGDGATLRLVRLAQSLDARQLPAEIRNRAAYVLLDTLGCIVAGATNTAGKIAAEHVRDERGSLQATLVGHGPVSLMPAAFANCVMGNALDSDAFGPEGHMAVVTAPAAFAVAEAL